MAAFGGRHADDPLRFSTGVLALGHGWRFSLCGGGDSGRRSIVKSTMSEKKIRLIKEPKTIPIHRDHSISRHVPLW
jgi:hypothetical protein